jgi:hypothetical protein
MLLPPASANRFIAEYKRVLLEIHRRSNHTEPTDDDIVGVLAAARGRLKKDPALIEEVASAFAAAGEPIQAVMRDALRSMRLEQWVFLRSTKRYAIFIDRMAQNAYAVLGLTNTIEEIVGAAAIALETAVLEFEGRYVCDGIVQSPVLLGPSYRRQFSAALADIRKAGNFHASPPKV